MDDTFKVVGTLRIVLTDSNGVVKEDHQLDNLVVNAGKSFIVNALTATSSSPFNYIGVGTNGTAATASDTTLGTEIGTRVSSTIATTTTSVTYTSVFAAGNATGTLQEAGIFNALTVGTMFSHTVFGSIVKGASDVLTIAWTININ